MPAVPQVYVFDNDSVQAVSHHGALSGLLDPFSATRTNGLLELKGARCLEVAAGGGGYAQWLADQVGDEGEVVATDIKPSHIVPRSNLKVLQHDIVNDPVPGTFDLVHARLVLNHLPARREVLHTLASALNPGGILLNEEFWSEPPEVFVAYAPNEDDVELLRLYHRTHMDVLTSHGNTRDWSKQVLGAMAEEGLTELRTVIHGGTWNGGGVGATLLSAGLHQMRTEFTEPGRMTEEQIDRVFELLADPAVILRGHVLYSTSGRRPQG
jgi:SAM-dependent methyltransferase